MGSFVGFAPEFFGGNDFQIVKRAKSRWTRCLFGFLCHPVLYLDGMMSVLENCPWGTLSELIMINKKMI
jgi:hypothetical protein